MTNTPEETEFHSEVNFTKSLTELLANLLNEKLSVFLEYCISTHNAEPIKEVLNILSRNQY